MGFKPDLWQPTGFLQCFDTVGLVIWPVEGILSEQLCAGLCDTMFSQSAEQLCEQFLQVKQIEFVTLGPLHCA